MNSYWVDDEKKEDDDVEDVYDYADDVEEQNKLYQSIYQIEILLNVLTNTHKVIRYENTHTFIDFQLTVTQIRLHTNLTKRWTLYLHTKIISAWIQH